MKKIQLTQGKFAIVDDEWFEELNRHKWRCDRGYAVRTITVSPGKQRKLTMHVLIAGTPDGLQTDHINGDMLDNRSENLRVCTNAENGRNRPAQRNSKTGLKGVSFHKHTNKFMAQIEAHDKKIYLGLFRTAHEAHAAYRKASTELHGEFAHV